MRPTLTEQISGSCRILETVVAPQVSGTPAARALEEVTRALNLIGERWVDVLPFLLWDNSETRQLLTDGALLLEPTERTHIQHVLASPNPTTWDAAAVEARNVALRGALSQLLLILDEDAPAQARFLGRARDHLDERSRRYPMRMVPTLNTSAPEKNSNDADQS